MATTNSITGKFAAAMRTLYKDIEDVTFRDRPLLGLLKKDENMVGESLTRAVQYTNGAGRSATFTTAQTNSAGPNMAKFITSRVKQYDIARIDRELVLASANDKGAALKAADLHVRSLINNVSDKLALALYRDSSGIVGRISTTQSSMATTTLTLQDRASHVAFFAGQVLKLTDQTDGTSLRTGTVTVSNVDRAAGTLTLSGNISTGISAAAAGDYIIVEGDATLDLDGLGGWCPEVVTSTTFHNVNRTLDSVRLGGNRIDGSSLPVERAIAKLCNQMVENGARPDYAFVGLDQWDKLNASLSSKQTIDVSAHGKAEVFYTGIKIAAGTGFVTILPDRFCLPNVAFAIESDAMVLRSLKGAPHIHDIDGDEGREMLTMGAEDSYEVRCGYYACLDVLRPVGIGRAKLAAV